MELFQSPKDTQTRWASFENPTAAKGAGGFANQGRKGAASITLQPGKTVTLLDIDGPGVVRRIWVTIGDRSVDMLRSLRIDMYWDGAKTPAVSAPFGDFFGIGLGRITIFECEFFANPENRSFLCFIPMPFKKHAKITLTNDHATKGEHLFYDVNLTLEPLPADSLYFHAHFRREQPTKLGKDFDVLPHVTGRGRFLGTNIGVILDPRYEGSWWGEGEVKMFLDGDQDSGTGTGATLVGTGSEDYISTAWGQGKFMQRYHGCPIADGPRNQWCMYRYHVVDPVYFHQECRVTYQQIGGARAAKVVEIVNRGAPCEPVTMASIKMFEAPNPPKVQDIPQDHWVNFMREDDVSAVSYFYLDRPENSLPPLINVAERTANLANIDESKRADT